MKMQFRLGSEVLRASSFAFSANANEETLMFFDKKNDLEIIARELSAEANFDGEENQIETIIKE